MSAVEVGAVHDSNDESFCVAYLPFKAMSYNQYANSLDLEQL